MQKLKILPRMIISTNLEQPDWATQTRSWGTVLPSSRHSTRRHWLAKQRWVETVWNPSLPPIVTELRTRLLCLRLIRPTYIPYALTKRQFDGSNLFNKSIIVIKNFSVFHELCRRPLRFGNNFCAPKQTNISLPLILIQTQQFLICARCSINLLAYMLMYLAHA